MLVNYFKISVRNLLKNRIYTFINVMGLSVGIASCLLIMLHVEDELSYDKFFRNNDHIYKLVLERLYPDHITRYAITPHSFSEVLKTDFPEVSNVTRIFGGGANNPVLVRYVNDKGEEKSFEETRFIAADSTFFDIFSFSLLKGDRSTALTKPQSMVVTRDVAKKYFGDDDPMGKTLITDFGEFNVTGVMENLPQNSHFDFEFVSSMTSIPFIIENKNFTGFSTHIYVELLPSAPVEQVEARFPQMVETYAAPQIESGLNTSYKDYVAAGNGYNYSLIPLTDIHLFPVEYQGEFKAGGNINDVYILTSIAALILFIACINFMNLATARSAERAKEVGIRKTLGSPRSQLIAQFLTESIVLSLLSTLIAIGIVYLTLPYFNELTGKGLLLNFKSWSMALIMLFAIVVGLLAGTYPAFVLSGFSPVFVMKGNLKTNKNTAWLRNSLVVFQFAISIILIASTLVVQDQMDFIQNRDLGYDKEHVIVIERAQVLNNSQEAFMKELRRMPGIKSAGGSVTIPVNQFFGVQFMPPGGNEVLTVNATRVDDNYINTMNFEVVQGRGFSEAFNDSLSIVINEQTAALLGFDDPVGMKLTNTTGSPPLVRAYEIVGVVKNFNYMTLRDAISPFILMSTEDGVQSVPFISVKIAGTDTENILSTIESKWKEMIPGESFKYKFLDQELNNQYKTETSTGKIFGVFAGLAIIIACVGLFGLAAYMAGLRTKEIGIRKVMGASVFKLVMLLSKEFTKLILIALLVAVPVSWYFMSEWLSSFAYKTPISVRVYLLAGFGALLIGWITVSYQSIKAAIINPVKSLRSE